jgi:hypothetical protein
VFPVHGLFNGIAGPEILHAFHELAFELIGDRVGHNEAFRGNAGLPVVLNPGFHCRCNRRLQIRAGNIVKCTKVGYVPRLGTKVGY